MSYDSKFYFVRVGLLNTEFYSKRLSIICLTLLGNRDVSGKQRKWTQSDPGTNITKYEKRNVCSQISQENFPQQPVSRCKDPMRFLGCLQPTFAKSSPSSWQSHISIKNSHELSRKDWSAQQVFASCFSPGSALQTQLTAAPASGPSLSSITCSEEDVFHLLSTCKGKTASRPGGICCVAQMNLYHLN